MVNPLPTQRLNFQNVGQKLQELKQLLLNHPVKVLVTLVISRGVWIPLLKSLALYGSAGLAIALRSKQTSEEVRKVVEAYLVETLEILLLRLDLT